MNLSHLPVASFTTKSTWRKEAEADDRCPSMTRGRRRGLPRRYKYAIRQEPDRASLTMQTGKNAMATAKEKAGNVAASAQSGMEKSKAMAQEKVASAF